MALRAVELEDGFGFALPDAVCYAVLRSVFAAVERSFDLNVCAFGERGGKAREPFPPHEAAMPLRALLPGSSSVFPGTLGRDGKDGVMCAGGGDFVFAIPP